MPSSSGQPSKGEQLARLSLQLQAALEFLEEGPERAWIDGDVAEGLTRRTWLLKSFVEIPHSVRAPDGEDIGYVLGAILPEDQIEWYLEWARELTMLNSPQSPTEMVDLFDAALFESLTFMINAVNELPEPMRGDCLRHIYRFQDEMSLVRASGHAHQVSRDALEVEAAKERAEDVVADIEEAASDVATSELATHYDHYFRREWWQAQIFRGMSLAVLASLVIYGAQVLLPDPNWDAIFALRKVAIITPLSVAAAYLAREAAGHRREARWAGVRSTQLKTLRAFTDGLDHGDRQSLRAEFGRVLFAQETSNSARALDETP
jgi:hypothetical protein